MKTNYFEALGLIHTKAFPSYIITGNNPFQKKKLLDALTLKYRQQNAELTRHYFPEESYDSLFHIHTSTSLFSQSRLSLLIFSKSPDKQAQKILVEIFNEQHSDDNTYLFIFESLNASQQRAKWFESVSRAALHIQLWPSSIPEAIRIIKDEVKQYNFSLTQDAIMLIAQKTEGNMLAAEQILQLLAMQNIKTFDCHNIHQCLDDFMSYDVFDLAQSITAQNHPRSLKILEHLFKEGIEPAIILWAILKEIRLWIKLSLQSTAERQKTFTTHNIWRSKQPFYTKLVSRFSKKAYSDLIERCLQIDFIIKGAATGSLKIELTQLVSKLHLS